ncbi:MAG: YicC family protein, partial [Acidobacteria bacterium]|nr:YicC family protein [Acidobacteriota bacterium]
QASAQEDTWGLTVTVRAFNHRFLDLRFRLPGDLEAAESQLRALVRGHVRRGHLDVRMEMERNGRPALEVDRDFVRSYLQVHIELQREHNLSGEPDLTALLRIPGVLRRSETALSGEDAVRLVGLAEKTLSEALKRLNEMRSREGAALENELRGRLGKVETVRKKLAELSERALPAFQQRLQKRLQELLAGVSLEPARLAQEAAYLAERSDISEELMRLASHANQFGQLLDSKAEAGKQLDFLLQEMNRETNTTLSKVPNLGAEGLEMTRLGLEIKAEIERLREQVQNVE